MPWDNLLAAAQAVFHFHNIILMFVGVMAGLIAGAIPGFTITMAIVLTLPFTFGLSPIEGLSTMIGVFVGGLSGGLMSGVLTGIPGTPSSVATTFDGFPMARKGRPALALGLGVWASFLGGIISAVLLVLLAPQLARIGLEFGPWGFFSLILFALTITASLAGEDLVKGLIAGAGGLLVAAVGEDSINGIARLTLGIEAWRQGFSFLPVLVGLFAFSQLLDDVRDWTKAQQPLMEAGASAVQIDHMAALRELVKDWVNLVRSSLIGLFVGILPAAGGSISNILAYDQAKKASRTPERFGTGIPDGIIAAESANNATAGGALIMMMALGIPGDIVTAIMLGALLIHNIAPSPTFIGNQPVLAYGIFIAYFISNFITLACVALALRMFVRVTYVPMYILAAVILIYAAIGIFALNNITFDLWTLFLFGILGYAMRELGFPLAPMILGVVLGDIAEVNLARALALSLDPTEFVIRPWSLFFLILAVFSAFFPQYQKYRGQRRWTNFYMPLLCIAVSPPLVMMGGWVRPALAVAVAVLGLVLLVRGLRGGTERAPAE